MLLSIRRRLSQGVRTAAQHGGVILGVAGLMLLWGAVLHTLSAERTQLFVSARIDTANLARAFEEHIIRAVKSIDQSLLFLREAYQNDPIDFDVARWLRSTQSITDLSFQIAIIHRSGMLRSSNLSPPGTGMDLSDREHFRVHRDRAADELFISKPVIGRASKKLSIQFTRRLAGPDGQFDGVIVLSIDPEYLSQFFDSVDLGRYGAVTLVGYDSIVRAAAQGRPNRGGAPDLPSAEPPILGRSIANGRLLSENAKASSGSFVGPSDIDGVVRVYSYRAVKGYPLLVSVGIGVDELFESVASHGETYFLVATILSILLLSITGLVFVRQRRLIAARERLLIIEASSLQKSHVLETTLEHMSQGLMMVDAERRVQVHNKRAATMLNLPPALLEGHPKFDDILRWQWEQQEFGENGNELEQSLRRLVMAGGISDMPEAYERARPDGTMIEVRSTPLPGGGVVRTYTDITASKQTERALREARDAADAAAKVKSEFLATMSHEIRSPMSGMLGVLDLLRDSSLDVDQAWMAAMIHDSAKSLLAVLNDILDFSKIDAGALKAVPLPTQLPNLIRAVAQPHAIEASARGVTLAVSISPGIPEWVDVDALRVRQILNNLLSNAVKFTRDGTIEVLADMQNGTALEITVRDTGIGMTAAVMSCLFQPFTQADSSTTRDFGGTGLGLCISHKLAEILGGVLEVQSVPGVGSVFVVKLPVQECQPATMASPSVPEHLVAQSGGFRVLIADDDPTNRWLSQRKLQLLGLTVDTAENGVVALEMLRRSTYSMLITDCHMPRMDGVALTRAVRADPDAALLGVPILGLTADVTLRQRARCLEAGMDHLLHKPLDSSQLAELLLPYLRGGRAGMPEGLSASPSEVRSSAIFDTSQFHDLFARDDPAGRAWLEEYVSLASNMIDEIEKLIRCPTDHGAPQADIVALSHRLSGCSLSAGASATGERARELEHAAQAECPSVLVPQLDALRDAFRDARAAIASFTAAPHDQLPAVPVEDDAHLNTRDRGTRVPPGDDVGGRLGRRGSLARVNATTP